MDSCLLCLELNKDFGETIHANTTRWQELNITKVLEKFFWPLSTLHPNCWICFSCWQELDNFHKFYLRIQEVHTKLVKVEEISLQEEKFASCYLQPEIPTNQKSYDALADETKVLIAQNDNKIDLYEINILNEDPLEKLAKHKNRKINSLEHNIVDEINIKSEPSNSSDHDYSALSDDDEDDVNDELDKNSLEIRKNKNCKKNDEFIAKNFKEMFCDLCSVAFKNFLDMQKHFLTTHDQNGYLVCCNRRFYQRYRLVNHLHSHLSLEHFKCAQCGKVLSNRNNLKNHMLRAHRSKDIVLKHSCDICGKSFTQGSLLRLHKLRHLPEVEKTFPCPECGKFYATAYLLNHHTKAVHLKKFVKICYICGKSISTSAEYKTHMDEHEGIPQPIISCDVCGLRLTSKRGLKRHKENQHPEGGKQDHPCPICPKVSPTLKALRKHIKNMHEESYDHKCNICEKGFKRAEGLREHMASHTGNTLYTCPWCPRTFNSNGNMHAHRRKVHPKEWREAKLQKYTGKLPDEIKTI